MILILSWQSSGHQKMLHYWSSFAYFAEKIYVYVLIYGIDKYILS